MKKRKLPISQIVLSVSTILIFMNILIFSLIHNFNNYWGDMYYVEFNYPIFWIVEFVLLMAIFISYGFFRLNGYQFTANVDLKDASDEFNSLYKKIYEQYNEKIKKVRGNLGNIEISIWTLFALSLISMITFQLISNTYYNEDVIAFILIMIAFFTFYTACILAIVKKKRTQKYRHYYKSNCISEILKLMNPNIIYDEISSEKENERFKYTFNECHCDGKTAWTVKGEDYIYLKKDNLEIELSDAKFLSMGDNPLFEGLFGFVRLDYYYTKHIRIKTGNLYENSDLPVINLDSSEFEEKFSVFCEDNIFAVRMLTPDIMEQLLEFYEKINLSFEINVYKDMLAIKFFTGKMFEPKLIGEPLDKEALYAYYEIIKFAEYLVLKLNKILKEFE